VKKLILALAFMLVNPVVHAAGEETGTPEVMQADEMLSMVRSFIRASGEVSQRGMAAVEDVMALMHEDMRYIHLEYGADFDKAAMREGFERRIARAATRGSQVTIQNHITGKNIVILETSGTYDRKVDDGWQPRSYDGHVTTYEFKDGKIWRVREYW